MRTGDRLYRAEVMGRSEALGWLLPNGVYRDKLSVEWKRLGGHVRNWEVRLTCKDGREKTVVLSNGSKSVAIPGWSEWGIATDMTEWRHEPGGAGG